jgi:hypothetical protein
VGKRNIVKQPENKKDMASYIIPAIVALIVAVFTPYLTYRWGLSRQIVESSKQKKQQAYSELMGRKAVMAQFYVSRFEALIYSDYHEALWKLAGSPKESLDLQEAQRWMHKSEDLALEIAKSNQALFETIGRVRTSFQNNTELHNLTDRIYRLKAPHILGQPFEMNPTQLEGWKVKAVIDLQELVEKEYSRPIDDLLNYLSKELNEDNK